MKNNIKSFQSLAALSVLSVLVAACGGGDGGAAPAPVPAPPPAAGPGPAPSPAPALPAGVADAACGSNGRMVIAAGAIDGVDEARAAQALSTGKLMVYGTIDNPTGTADIQARYWSAMRLNEDCSVDTGYANHGRAFHAVSNPAYQVQDIHQVVSAPDGSAHLFGVSEQTFVSGGTSYPIQPAATMVRLLADGSLDTAVGTSVQFQTRPDSPYPADLETVAATPLPDGRWLTLAQGGTRSAWTLTRLMADGKVDETFASGGRLAVTDAATSAYPSTVNSTLTGIATDRAGKILISGVFNTAGHYVCPAVMRLNADGSLDASFGVSGVTVGECDNVEARTRIKVLDSGKILVASTGLVPGRFQGVTVRRLNADGALDLSYGTGGIARVDLDDGIAPDCDKSAYQDKLHWAFDTTGNVYVGGTMYCLTSRNAQGLGKRWHGGVARLTVDGALDTGFGTRGRFNTLERSEGQDEVLQGLAVTADAKLVIVSTARKEARSPSTWVVYRVK
jgi:uncharacterized delta-60 repeat protein